MYNGTNWITLGDKDVSISFEEGDGNNASSLYVSNGIPYVAYDGINMMPVVKIYNGTNWIFYLRVNGSNPFRSKDL